MNLRTITLAVSVTTLVATASSFGQVIIRGTQSSDQSASNSVSSSAVTINTGDRDVVPLIKESKDTKVDANTQRTESVTRARLSDGSYFEWQRSTTVKKDISPSQSVSSTDVVEKDRQGQSRVSSTRTSPSASPLRARPTRQRCTSATAAGNWSSTTRWSPTRSRVAAARPTRPASKRPLMSTGT